MRTRARSNGGLEDVVAMAKPLVTNEALLADLTEAQREAVTHVDGPLLIVAAAGSGKTRVITRRVAYLMGLGIEPASILAITFTNKAAGEMKARVGQTLGRELRDFGRLDQHWPLICTFHSLGLRVLKRFSVEAGLGPNFTIYDSDDQAKLVKEAIRAADLSTTQFPAGAVHAEISHAKNQMKGPDEYSAAARAFPFTQYAKAYRQYERLLRHNNALDFDDLLKRTVELLREKPAVLEALQDRFRYVLIDEYQDTNNAQYLLANALASKHRNLCVVGDPDQSIYAWRGADIRNILDFERDYRDAKVVKLEQNYRSTKTILEIAGKLIAHNRQRKDKRLLTDNAQGERATFYVCGDEHEEALHVARHLKRLREEHGYQWGQMAVFYRINALSRVMEDALRREVIPYRIARGVEFYQRAHVKDVLAYLKVIANPADELSLDRIVNVPARGVGDAALDKLRALAGARGIALHEALPLAEEAGVSGKAAKGARAFAGMLARWRASASAATAKGAVARLLEDVVRTSGLEEYYKKVDTQAEKEVPDVAELISDAATFDAANPEGGLEEYLQQVSLVSDVDRLPESGGAVTLMTLHAAKGLEFPVVAIIAMEEGALPHARVQQHPEQLEEERRLCFVGITRAQQRLVLSRATYRRIRGLRERTAASRFLAEMPATLLEVIDRSGLDFDEDRDGDVEFGRDEDGRGAASFRTGQKVRHPEFGVGTIAEIVAMGRQTRVVVDFARAGRKRLILEYARLEPA